MGEMDDPANQAEIAAAAMELSPLLDLYAEGKVQEVWTAVAQMESDDVRRLLGFSISVLTNLLFSMPE